MAKLSKSRARGLILLLGLLILGLAIRDLAAWLPREPRLYLQNESGVPLDGAVIRSNCGDIKLPRLRDGQLVRLDLHPRAGCTYEIKSETINNQTIEGGFLLALLALAREEKGDVRLELGIDYLEADVTRPHWFW